MEPTNHRPQRPLSAYESLTCHLCILGRGGDNRPSEGPGGGIKLTNHLGSAISTGNTLAINTNSLLQCTPWPINVSKAETGNSDE